MVFSKWRANARAPFTSELTDGGLKHLGRRGPGLLDVNLAGVHLVSAAGVSALVTACPTIRSLNLAGCSQLCGGPCGLCAHGAEGPHLHLVV